jgi:hypothetical protein
MVVRSFANFGPFSEPILYNFFTAIINVSHLYSSLILVSKAESLSLEGKRVRSYCACKEFYDTGPIKIEWLN